MAQIQRVLVILGGIGPQKRIFSAGEGNYTRFWFRGKQFHRVGEYTPVSGSEMVCESLGKIY